MHVHVDVVPGGVTIVTKGVFVFIVSHCEISTYLSNMSFPIVGAV